MRSFNYLKILCLLLTAWAFRPSSQLANAAEEPAAKKPINLVLPQKRKLVLEYPGVPNDLAGVPAHITSVAELFPNIEELYRFFDSKIEPAKDSNPKLKGEFCERLVKTQNTRSNPVDKDRLIIWASQYVQSKEIARCLTGSTKSAEAADVELRIIELKLSALRAIIDYRQFSKTLSRLANENITLSRYAVKIINRIQYTMWLNRDFAHPKAWNEFVIEHETMMYMIRHLDEILLMRGENPILDSDKDHLLDLNNTWGSYWRNYK